MKLKSKSRGNFYFYPERAWCIDVWEGQMNDSELKIIDAAALNQKCAAKTPYYDDRWSHILIIQFKRTPN